MTAIQTSHGSMHASSQGDGVPMILLHNGFEDSRTWQTLAAQWSVHHKVITYDRPGFGTSDWPADPAEYTDLVREGVIELALLLDALSLKNVILIGHCLGAAIAFSFAAANPENVRAIVSEACGFFSDTAIRERCRMVFCPWDELGEEYKKELLQMHGEEKARFFWGICRDHTSSYVMNKDYSILPLLSDIKCPVLVAAGDDDFLFSVEHTTEGFRALPNARLWIAPMAGHNLHRLYHKDFSITVNRFLKEV